MPEGLFADPASGPALASRGSRVSRRFLQQLPPGHGGPRHWRFGPPAPKALEPGFPGTITGPSVGMTVEVHDVRSDHHLPTKLPTRQATVAESVPDQPLRPGHVAAQLSSTTDQLVIGRLSSDRHVRSPLTSSRSD